MKRFVSLAVFALLLCFGACETMGPARRPAQQPAPQQPAFTCEKRNVVPVRTKAQYSDDYGTMMTSDAAALATPAKNYRWGIKNSKTPLSMAYYTFYVRPEGRYRFFGTSIYIDRGIKAPLTFVFRNNDRNGEVLKSVTVYPGQTVDVDVEVTGLSRVLVRSELRINHDKAEKIIMGEPEFYNCR